MHRKMPAWFGGELRGKGPTHRHLAAQLTRYITNDPDLTADEVINQARQRCNQENLISQLKSGVRALHAPVNTLNANWAYMTMAALAWTLKAWIALLLPVTPRWAERHNEQRRRLLTMEFRTFAPSLHRDPLPDRHAPADACAGASSPTTHGSERSSASSTPSDLDQRILIQV